MMRTVFLILLVALMSGLGSAQAKTSKLEQHIRQLDADAAKAILEKNEAAVDRFFAKDAVVNNPRNSLTIGSDGIKAAFKNGIIDYAFFERNIESVQIRGTSVIIMGNEVFAMKGKNGEKGPTVHRRYTNVWMKTKGIWQIVARHASIICP